MKKNWYTSKITLWIFIGLALGILVGFLGMFNAAAFNTFKPALNLVYTLYINALRIDRACALLRDPARSIAQVIDLCGYQNPRTFHRAFQSHCGMTPKQYRATLSAEASGS